MAKLSKERCDADSRHDRMTLFPLASSSRKCSKKCYSNKRLKASEKRDWENAICSVCLEHPHNSVLLLCSSYNKGCRPYMCSTSRRFSNCLEQYKKAYTKVTSTEGLQQGSRSMDCSSGAELANQLEVPELLCPLCRGQVKGWTVVEPARKHLNAKKRSCMQDKCSFVGTYNKLRKHVRAKHPLARPRAVDPVLKEKWKKLECERERSDVISTIMSSTPGALVLGDYVIEPGHRDIYDDSDSDYSSDDDFLLDEVQASGIRYRDQFNLDDIYRFPRHRLPVERLLGRASRRRGVWRGNRAWNY
ncbi:hypothetical protein Tsubulata_014438 [Turnera subulata]|uniref:Uncharacterized protein n=1 Tax=Turnera subulata TaxID=218843 RepID=A0A9Q0FPX4_9ROSI|nr:hypothetical protein Tsubulata_014438 [Turnera subulata]